MAGGTGLQTQPSKGLMQEDFKTKTLTAYVDPFQRWKDEGKELETEFGDRREKPGSVLDTAKIPTHVNNP